MLPRILIASDQALVTEDCVKLLEPEFQVVGCIANEPALLAAVPELKPDVIILDIGDGWTSGLETRVRIKKLTRMVRIVYLTGAINVDVASDVLRGGASGYLLRSSYGAELVSAIRDVLQGKRYISEPIMQAIAEITHDNDDSHPGRKNLTERQREVLKLLAEGRTMKEIAYVLMLTPRTVAFHKYKLMERLHLQTNADLIQYAIQEHIVSPRF
jgi:DNA-binding NarL/FixJ family response regulator